jgi:hypothetical protein
MLGKLKQVKDKNPKVFTFGYGNRDSVRQAEGQEALECLRATVRMWISCDDGPAAGAELHRFITHYIRTTAFPLNAAQVYNRFPVQLRRYLAMCKLHGALQDLTQRGILHVSMREEKVFGEEEDITSRC